MQNPTCTLIRKFSRLFAANSTASSITPPVPTATEPANGDNGIFDNRVDNPTVLNNILLAFYGVGNAGQAASARITAWHQTVDGSLWIPTPLMTLTLTLGAQLGIVNTMISATHKFVKTIAAGTAFTSANEVISPGADGTIAMVAIDPKGAPKIQVDLAIIDCTSINGLWKGF